MFDITLTNEIMNNYINVLEDELNSINEDLPSIAGEGDIVTALMILNNTIAHTILHAQRTFVMTCAVIDALVNAKPAESAKFTGTTSEFKIAGSDNGPASVN